MDYDARWQKRFDAAQQRLFLKERAIAYKGGKCEGCGYCKCPAALDFHHPNPKVKEANPSSKMSWESLRIELDKCILLCANCHRETHAGWRPEFIDGDEYGSYLDDLDLVDAELLDQLV